MKLPSARVAGVFLLASIGLASSASLVWHAEPIGRGRTDKEETVLALRRFEPLRRILPPHATVGYEADSENPLEDRAEVKRFYFAQYALAPAIVVAGVDRDLVVGNYRDPDKNCRICRSGRFVLQNDFGGGLMLFRRTAR
ncbi:MAG: hypothetical protein ACM3SU_06775 [Acidobacteriota bacterium]